MRFLACLWPYALFGALVQSLQCAEPLVRKEWYFGQNLNMIVRLLTISTVRRSLSIEERSNYISAVKCLQAKEPTSSKDTLPGATNRFEDFVGDHILQTVTQHFTVSTQVMYRQALTKLRAHFLLGIDSFCLNTNKPYENVASKAPSHTGTGLSMLKILGHRKYLIQSPVLGEMASGFQVPSKTPKKAFPSLQKACLFLSMAEQAVAASQTDLSQT